MSWPRPLEFLIEALVVLWLFEKLFRPPNRHDAHISSLPSKTWTQEELP
jgi:hypothetical protein